MTPRTRLTVGILAGLLALVAPTALAAVEANADNSWVAPVNAPIWGGFGAPHYGVDIGAKRFVPIRAASSGIVVTRKCNAHVGDVLYSCDIDGSPTVKGCGWYVDIQHAGGLVTRYCHMVQAPLVKIGDVVTTGQRIGYVGSSGNSSAPHLHFEVHRIPRGGVAQNSNAIDPVPFMRDRGAPLGRGNDEPEPPDEQPPFPTPPADPEPHDPRSDVDGDGLSDPLVWRSSDGQWYLPSGGGSRPIVTTTTPPGDDLPVPGGAPEGTPVELGLPGDVPVIDDYDGDGIDDLAVWRPTDGRWLVQTSSGAAVVDPVLGNEEDIPAPADFDGDGLADFAVWRAFPPADADPNGAQWLILHTDGTHRAPVEMGEPGDLPVPADYDGDGRDDLALWRPASGSWLIRPSSGIELPRTVLGEPGDFPVPGDYDGDGLYDFAVWRPSTGEWLVRYAIGRDAEPVSMGSVGDRPVVGDYDGDGTDDLALWRSLDGTWLIRTSSDQAVVEVVNGLPTDIPTNAPLWIDPADGNPLTLADVLVRRANISLRDGPRS